MSKEECLQIFNNSINGVPIDFNKIITLISDYLTEINSEKLSDIINLLIQNPQLANNFLPEVIKYYTNKYNLLIITDSKKNNMPILYYD